jgi:hypothetical protein
VVEFDLACDCHPGRFVGKAKRTGLRTDGAVDRPVYFLYTVAPHEELRDQLAMLAPEGLLLLGKSLVGGYRD